MVRSILVLALLGRVAAADPALAAGGSLACARTHDGRLACWGNAPDGMHATPSIVPGLSDVAGVTIAGGRVLAWTTRGDAWQWTGKLSRLSILDAVELAGSDDAACARRRDGTVACWLGTGAPTDAIKDAAQLVVADHEACARTTAGDVACWAIGAAPQPVASARGAIAIAGADRGTRGPTFAAVLPHGRLVAWAYAWVPPNTAASPGAPTNVVVPAVPPDITGLAVGDLDMCALGAGVTCWADDPKPIVRRIDGAAGARAIAVGNAVSCAAMPDASVRCWGTAGYLGDGAAPAVTTPVEVAGIADAVELGASGESACVRRANGHVACWGARLTDDWGMRARTIDLVPREVPGIADAAALFVGLREACARRTNGHVACWGWDGTTTFTRATDRPALANATWLGVLDSDVCALQTRRIWCGALAFTEFHRVPAKTTELWLGSWYRGSYLCARAQSQITCQERWVAHGESDVGPASFDIDLSDVVAMQLPINQDLDTVCVVHKGGDVACAKMLGGGAVSIDGVAGVHALVEGPGRTASSGAATCAVANHGTVACWDSGSVWTIPAIANAIEVAGAGSFGCAREQTGKVACWGQADYLGNGLRATTDVPVVVRGL